MSGWVQPGSPLALLRHSRHRKRLAVVPAPQSILESRSCDACTSAICGICLPPPVRRCMRCGVCRRDRPLATVAAGWCFTPIRESSRAQSAAAARTLPRQHGTGCCMSLVAEAATLCRPRMPVVAPHVRNDAGALVAAANPERGADCPGKAQLVLSAAANARLRRRRRRQQQQGREVGDRRVGVGGVRCGHAGAAATMGGPWWSDAAAARRAAGFVGAGWRWGAWLLTFNGDCPLPSCFLFGPFWDTPPRRHGGARLAPRVAFVEYEEAQRRWRCALHVVLWWWCYLLRAVCCLPTYPCVVVLWNSITRARARTAQHRGPHEVRCCFVLALCCIQLARRHCCDPPVSVVVRSSEPAVGPSAARFLHAPVDSTLTTACGLFCVSVLGCDAGRELGRQMLKDSQALCL